MVLLLHDIRHTIESNLGPRLFLIITLLTPFGLFQDTKSIITWLQSNNQNYLHGPNIFYNCNLFQPASHMSLGAMIDMLSEI